MRAAHSQGTRKEPGDKPNACDSEYRRSCSQSLSQSQCSIPRIAFREFGLMRKLQDSTARRIRQRHSTVPLQYYIAPVRESLEKEPDQEQIYSCIAAYVRPFP